VLALVFDCEKLLYCVPTLILDKCIIDFLDDSFEVGWETPLLRSLLDEVGLAFIDKFEAVDLLTD
jgi:hypothetical protein